MSDDFEIELVLYHKKLSIIYNTSYLIIMIVIATIIIAFTYKYQTYYVTKGRITENKLEIIVTTDNMKYLNNDFLYIDNKKYKFKLISISKELSIDNKYNNYRYAYLEANNLITIENYVYEVKIPKEKKILAKYIKEELWN